MPLSRTLDHVGPLDARRRRRVARVSRAPRRRAAAAAAGAAAGTACASRCRADTSATCWTTRCGRGSRRRSTPAHGRRAHRRRRDPRMRPTSRRSICTSCWATRRPITRPRSRRDARALHAARAPAARNGPLHAGRGLRAGAGRPRGPAREVDAALAEHDALVLPTLPIPAPPLGATSVQVGATNEPVRNLMLRLTQLFNVTGHPAISLPCGRRRLDCRAAAARRLPRADRCAARASRWRRSESSLAGFAGLARAARGTFEPPASAVGPRSGRRRYVRRPAGGGISGGGTGLMSGGGLSIGSGGRGNVGAVGGCSIMASRCATTLPAPMTAT